MSVAEPENLVLSTPKWLEALENKRKKPHRLAHEVGAGSPCLVCKEKCKGLNLHFWRKICIECKCRKEDHDFEEEEDYAQFEILFGAKKINRTTLKYNAQNKTFDWIPPNVPQDLAVDYLKALPESKLPISNTEGAKYRKQQLEKQLPLHDVDPNACHDLTDKELQEFEKYLDNLRSHVIGQGKVLKYQKPQLYKEKFISGPSPISQVALNQQQKINPEWAGSPARITVDKISDISNTVSQKVNTEAFPIDSILKKESIDKTHAFSEYPKGISHSPQTIQSNKSSQTKPDYLNNQNLNNLLNPQTEFSSQVSPKIPEISLPCPKPFKTSVINNPFEHKVNSTEVINNEGRSSPLRTPSSFIQRKSPVFDKQNNNATFQHQDDNCNEKLEPLSLAETIQHSIHPSNIVYSQGNDALADYAGKNNSVPYQKQLEAPLDVDLVRNLNGMNVSSDEVPFVPVQESQNISGKRAGDVAPTQKGTETKLPEILTESLPMPPQTCRQCFQVFNSEDIVVQTERGGCSALWHARCFVCETCKELLVDLMYFFNKGNVYCGRHYAELMNIPRCFACDELIFVKEYTCAEGENYHFRHFCCFHCDDPLGGKQYIAKDGHPVCLQCYQVEYGKNCQTCQKPITAGEQRVSWKELNFHVSPQCFRCAKCLNSLLGGKFMVKNNNTFCSKECVQEFIE